MYKKKYIIPEISAHSILSAAKEIDGEMQFRFDTSDPSKEYLTEKTQQDDCPIFYQAMTLLYGKGFQTDVLSDKLSEAIAYIDFSGIFDRKPVGHVLERQKLAEQMFSQGIWLDFGKGKNHFLPFERSASMSRQNRLAFVREDLYEPLCERMMLGMSIGKCQLSKLYAYNGLMFTSGTRIDSKYLLNSDNIIVVDNPKSIIQGANIITVEDDGTDNAMRKYTRVERISDIEVLEFDGEGLVSAKLSGTFDKSGSSDSHHSFQIRLPYIKGMVHEVDFKSLFAELNGPYIIDLWGVKHDPADVDLILTKSMFKGYGWMTENGLTWSEYLERCLKYDHALYVSGMDKAEPQTTTELNYQFLNTLAMTNDEFRPLDLPLGWTRSPEWDSRQWITKTTETEYYKLTSDNDARIEYFTAETGLEITDKRHYRAELLKKNPLFIDEPIFTKELDDKAANILRKYSVGQLIVAGDNRYLSDDLIRLLGHIVRTTMGKSYAYRMLEQEFLSENTVYAPQPRYPESEVYTLLRSPHIARNEEALVKPLADVGSLRKKYLSHLHYVLMVDSRSLIPERLGGADYDGDMVKTIADPLLNKCVLRSYSDGVPPVLKIPAAEPLISDAKDWKARFETVKSTFSSRVGQISNAALRSGIVAYNEKTPPDDRAAAREVTETLAILTGLEIDSAKTGIKPDLSDYLGNRRLKSLFLRSKSIIGDNRERKWYEPTKTQRMKKLIESTDWDSVTSNLERLPYYAYMLDKQTKKVKPTTAADEKLFVFASNPDWKDNLDSYTLERMKSIIAAYETALSRCRFLRHNDVDMRRKGDIERILFARGQENDYSIDELYSIFEYTSPENIRRARRNLSEYKWHLTPPEDRELTIWEMLPHNNLSNYFDLFCDFRQGGYRVLGDIVCDMDDMYRRQSAAKNIVKSGDSDDLKHLLWGIERTRDYKDKIVNGCLYLMHPSGRNAVSLNFNEATKCAIAMGKRQFAMEVLTHSVLELALDTREPIPKKRRWRLFGK